MISFPTWRCRKIATVHANPLHFQQVAPYVESRHGDSMLPAIDADTLAPVIFRRCYLPCMCGCILRWSPYTLEKTGVYSGPPTLPRRPGDASPQMQSESGRHLPSVFVPTKSPKDSGTHPSRRVMSRRGR